MPRTTSIERPWRNRFRQGEPTAACNVFDIYTIIFLALAVFIFIRLRSVLGQRTGRERPPYDPYSRRDAAKAPAGASDLSLIHI